MASLLGPTAPIHLLVLPQAPGPMPLWLNLSSASRSANLAHGLKEVLYLRVIWNLIIPHSTNYHQNALWFSSTGRKDFLKRAWTAVWYWYGQGSRSSKDFEGIQSIEAIDIYNHIDKKELKESYLAHIPQLGIRGETNSSKPFGLLFYLKTLKST